MLYREIIAVCSEIHKKHINTVCGQKVALFNVKSGSTYINHWAQRWNSLQFLPQQALLQRQYGVNACTIGRPA
jgi:hypothetical protein